jgi:hypothetical protein
VMREGEVGPWIVVRGGVHDARPRARGQNARDSTATVTYGFSEASFSRSGEVREAAASLSERISWEVKNGEAGREGVIK